MLNSIIYLQFSGETNSDKVNMSSSKNHADPPSLDQLLNIVLDLQLQSSSFRLNFTL